MNKPYTVKEAADYLGIAAKSLNNLISFGKITCYKPNGKMIYFKESDLEAYAYRNKRAADYELNEEAVKLLNAREKA